MKGTIKTIKVLDSKVRIKDSRIGTIMDTYAPFHPYARITEEGQVRLTEEVETRIPD